MKPSPTSLLPLAYLALVACMAHDAFAELRAGQKGFNAAVGLHLSRSCK